MLVLTWSMCFYCPSWGEKEEPKLAGEEGVPKEAVIITTTICFHLRQLLLKDRPPPPDIVQNN